MLYLENLLKLVKKGLYLSFHILYYVHHSHELCFLFNYAEAAWLLLAHMKIKLQYFLCLYLPIGMLFTRSVTINYEKILSLMWTVTCFCSLVHLIWYILISDFEDLPCHNFRKSPIPRKVKQRQALDRINLVPLPVVLFGACASFQMVLIRQKDTIPFWQL